MNKPDDLNPIKNNKKGGKISGN